MRSEEISTFINTLKEEIQRKYGKEVAYAKDCQTLSYQIMESTKRQLSVSTLKRFFGIIESPFSPSKFTLDSFSVYLGFSNWQDFVNCFEIEKHRYSQFDSWNQLKHRVNAITEVSLESIESKGDSIYEEIPLRTFAEQHFRSFLDAPQVATAFIAPGGYGKTTLLTQLTKKYFTGDNALYPDDIVCLIDGSILYNLITQNARINRLYQLLKFDPQSSFSNYFRENPDKVKGRFVMVIDGFNEMHLPPDKLNEFIGNLLKIVAAYENVSWFKLVISCRPDIWKAFSFVMRKNPILQNQWYNVRFKQALSSNIPLLNREELESCCNNNLLRIKESVEQELPELEQLFAFPLFLHWMQTRRIGKDSQSAFAILKQYISEVLLSGPYKVETIQLLKMMVKHSDKGRKGTSVPVEKLFPSGFPSLAYQEMVSFGLLREFTKQQSFLDLTIYVDFSQKLVFEFLLANTWIEEYGLSKELLDRIGVHYHNTRELRDTIQKLILQYAAYVGDYGFMGEILELNGQVQEERSLQSSEIEMVPVGLIR